MKSKSVLFFWLLSRWTSYVCITFIQENTPSACGYSDWRRINALIPLHASRSCHWRHFKRTLLSPSAGGLCIMWHIVVPSLRLVWVLTQPTTEINKITFAFDKFIWALLNGVSLSDFCLNSTSDHVGLQVYTRLVNHICLLCSQLLLMLWSLQLPLVITQNNYYHKTLLDNE